MEKKVLSIGIAAYNMELFLARCLDSLIIPDIDKLEIIVVNHASTDRTHDIAMEYKTKYPNSIKVVDVKVNGHYGRAVNNALTAATGKYFKLLDADDTYYNENLPQFVDYLSKIDVDVVFSPYLTLDYDSNLVDRFVCPKEYSDSKMFLFDDIDWTDSRIKRFRAMHSMAIKTEVLQLNKYYQTEGIAYSDTQLVFFADLYSDSCSFYDKPIYNYYLGRDGQTMSLASTKKNCLHFYKNAVRMFDVFEEFCKYQTVSHNRIELLSDSINTEISFFFGTVIGGFKDISQYTQYIEELYSKGQSSNWQEVLVRKMNSHPWFSLYNRFHIPNNIIYYYRSAKSKIARLIKRS